MPITEQNLLIGNACTVIATGRPNEKTWSWIVYSKGSPKVQNQFPAPLLWYNNSTLEFFPDEALAGIITHKRPPTPLKECVLPDRERLDIRREATGLRRRERKRKRNRKRKMNKQRLRGSNLVLPNVRLPL
jgi:hypothetical protein